MRIALELKLKSYDHFQSKHTEIEKINLSLIIYSISIWFDERTVSANSTIAQ